MIDLVLFAGRILLVVLLYLFLFAIAKTGIGLVKGQRSDTSIWCIDVEKGPKNLRGLHIDMLGPVVIGRAPSCDVVIAEPFVSGNHARFTLQGPALVLEDLHSTKGTMVNGHEISRPVTLRESDEVQIGDAVMRVSRR